MNTARAIASRPACGRFGAHLPPSRCRLRVGRR